MDGITAVEQNEAKGAPSEITAQADSTPIKTQHGGKRAGAGRKPNLVKRMIGRLKPASAAEVLAGIDIEGTMPKS